MSKKPAALGASIIATKGAAAPTLETSLNLAKQAESEATEKRTAITLKLLHSTYMRMKIHGAVKGKTNQNILEEALNNWLDKEGA